MFKPVRSVSVLFKAALKAFKDTKSLNCILMEWINTHVRLKSHVCKEWNILSITFDLHEARSVRPCSGGGPNWTSFLSIHRVPGYHLGEVDVDTKKHSANPWSQLDPSASASCDLSYQRSKTARLPQSPDNYESEVAWNACYPFSIPLQNTF